MISEFQLPPEYTDLWLRFVNRQPTNPLSDQDLQLLEQRHAQVQDLHLQLDQILFEQRLFRNFLKEQAETSTEAKSLLTALSSHVTH